ncbi:hypothetical protein JAAARDRAFT_62079 [Jaapia argillacea MUCL 33604]|uniref:Uncharacterized protein n=1 Tax=Jaapia argillacea MUCL 33604 TaxID=933084 RepID=A0A067PLZ6_9AGAM|nr:hypothetical protein JAAARDRAFT_62079 [Jaapia argillacea MUCL 33604]
MGEICHRMAFDSDSGKTTLQFSARASEAVTTLSKALLNTQFLCKECPTIGKGSARRKDTYTWRQAVPWEAISPEHFPAVGTFDSAYNQAVWICSHRTICLTDVMTREALIGHCRDRDFFFDPLQDRLLGVPSTIRVGADGVPIDLSNTKTYKCLHCDPQSKRGRREFGGTGVESHLKDVHAIHSVVQGRDYAAA